MTRVDATARGGRRFWSWAVLAWLCLAAFACAGELPEEPDVLPEDELVVAIVSNVQYGLWNAWGPDVVRLVDGETPLLAIERYTLAPLRVDDIDRAVGRRRMGRYATTVDPPREWTRPTPRSYQ